MKLNYVWGENKSKIILFLDLHSFTFKERKRYVFRESDKNKKREEVSFLRDSRQGFQECPVVEEKALTRRNFIMLRAVLQ